MSTQNLGSILSISGETLEKMDKIPVPMVNIRHKTSILKENTDISPIRRSKNILVLNNSEKSNPPQEIEANIGSFHVDKYNMEIKSEKREQILNQKGVKSLLDFNRTNFNFGVLPLEKSSIRGSISARNSPTPGIRNSVASRSAVSSRSSQKFNSSRSRGNIDKSRTHVRSEQRRSPRLTNSSSTLSTQLNQFSSNLLNFSNIVSGPYHGGLSNMGATSILPHMGILPVINSRQFLIGSHAPSAAKTPRLSSNTSGGNLKVKKSTQDEEMESKVNKEKYVEGRVQQSPLISISNQAQFDLVHKIQELNSVDDGDNFDRPSIFRIAKAMEALSLIAK